MMSGKPPHAAQNMSSSAKPKPPVMNTSSYGGQSIGGSNFKPSFASIE
jgi:hypothetical protein